VRDVGTEEAVLAQGQGTLYLVLSFAVNLKLLYMDKCYFKNESVMAHVKNSQNLFWNCRKPHVSVNKM
jgi:hypothetical protein